MTTARETRQTRIDRQLAKAGWAVGSRQVLSEMPLPAVSKFREDEGRYRVGDQFVDYALLDGSGRVLAIVEAKRTGRDSLEGQRQAADYADMIRKTQDIDPFVFLANGDEIWFWHRDLYPPRPVSGFFSEERINFLSHTIAPLLRFSVAGSYHELQFESLTEQLALAKLKADDAESARLAAQVIENLTLLPANLPEIRPHHELLVGATSPAFWLQADYSKIMEVQEVFAPLMRFRNRRPAGTFVKLSLPDEIKQRHWLIFGPSSEGTFAETYRARVEALVRDLADDHPALQRLKRGEDLGPDDLAALAETLNRPDLFVTEESLLLDFSLKDTLEDVFPYGLSSQVIEFIAERIEGCKTGAEAVLRLFSEDKNIESTPFDVFNRLRDWERTGLMEHLTLTVRRLGTDNEISEHEPTVVCYDQLSDGEQVLLGRMGLLFLLRGQDGSLLLLDEPETHFNLNPAVELGAVLLFRG